MTKRNVVFGIVSVLGIATLFGTGASLFAQDSTQKGQARVVERRGPELDLGQNARGQVVVLFPGALQAQGSEQGGDVEISFVESQFSQSADNGAQQGQAQPTGREILFSSRDAQNGVVSHSLDAVGNGRKLMLIARVNGEMVEVRHTGGTEGVMFYTVQRPEPKQQQTAESNAGNGFAQTGGSPAGEGSQGSGGGQQAQGQMDQSQTQQLQQRAQQPQQAAVIVVYTAGGQP